MILHRAQRARSRGVQPSHLLLCVVILALANLTTALSDYERLLSDINREYLASEPPIAHERRQKCAGVEQLDSLKGEWVKHPDHSYQGMTDPKNCPDFVADYDCRSSDVEAIYHSHQQKEFRKVFRPFACDLHAMNATHFSQCLQGQRIIIIGDSTMRQVFQSLACLLHEEIVEGYLVPWEKALPSQTAVPFENQYLIRGTQTPILKQNVGMFKLRNGAEVHFQSFGIFNATLWDDVMAKFMPLTKKDFLFLEFGAWYPRFAVRDMQKPWERYRADMQELFEQRLIKYSTNVLWRAYGPTHYGTNVGTFTGISMELPDMPPQDQCEPAKYGEFYYDTEIIRYIKFWGEHCSHIHILPVYHLSLPAHNSHHGSFGRGISEGAIDCRHYCANVVDTWSQVLYNKLCFQPLGKGLKSRQLAP